MNFHYLLLFLLCCALPTALRSQELVANINQTNNGSEPSYLQSNGDWAVFVAKTDGTVEDLYVVDTPGGNARPFGRRNTLGGEDITRAYLVGNRVYLSTDTFDDSKLWVADLTTGTYTQLISETPTFRSQAFMGATAYGGETLLTVSNFGTELYLTDDTAANTRKVATVTDANIQGGLLVDGQIAYFLARRNGETPQVWRTDATEDGTYPLTNFDPGRDFYAPRDLTRFNDRIYFIASEIDDNFKLYSIDDGAASRVESVQAGFQGDNERILRVANDTLFFLARTDADGYNLYYTDGETSGLYADLMPPGQSLRYASGLVMREDFAYFNASNMNGVSSLWRTDFSAGGASILIKYYTEGTEPFNTGSQRAFTDDDIHYFVRFDSLTGQEIWSTDGTPAGTRARGEVYPGPAGGNIGRMVGFGDYIYFIGSGDEVGQEVWVTGLEDNVSVLLDINMREGSSFPFPYFVNAAGELILEAFNSCVGRELFSTGGDATTTMLVRDINPGPRSSDDFGRTLLNGELYYIASTSLFREALIRSDGTAAGTRPAFGSGEPATDNFGAGGIPYAFRGKIYQMVFVPDRGDALIAYDPITEAVDTIIRFSGGGYSGSKQLIALNDSILLFTSQIFNEETGLYRTDGTADEVTRISSNGVNLGVSHQGFTYFTIDNSFDDPSDSYNSLFRTDGETVTVIPNTDGLTSIFDVVAVGDRVYFTTQGFFGSGSNLFYIESESGVVHPLDIPGGLKVSSLATDGRQLYFVGYYPGESGELWFTNGTLSGTRAVTDFRSAFLAAAPRDFTFLGDTLYFTAHTPAAGRELYRTTGTLASTELIGDIHPGSGSSNPTNLFDYNGVLYFSADDGIIGAELWRYDPANPMGTDPDNDPNAVSLVCSTLPTGLTESLPASAVSVAPNPSSDLVTVTLTGGLYSLQLFDLQGHPVWQSGAAMDRVTLRANDLPSGTYLLRTLALASGATRMDRVVIGR